MLPHRPHGLDAYRIDGEPIGVGAFARLVRATGPCKDCCALKLICCCEGKEAETLALAAHEVSVHTHVGREPSMLPLMDAFVAECTNGSAPECRRTMQVAVLKMPLMVCDAMRHVSQDHETIWGDEAVCCAVQALSSAEVKGMFVQMVNAVRRCHDLGVSHNDIKLENFLLAPDGSLRLCDFGVSTWLHPDPQRPDPIAALGKQGGSMWTMSAARLQGCDEGAAADWFSLGVLLYQLHCRGAWPFKRGWTNAERCGDVRAAVLRAVFECHVQYQGSVASAVPAAARELIARLLEPDAARRGGLEAVLRSSFLDERDYVGVGDAYPWLRGDMQQLRDMRSRLLLAPQRPAAAWQQGGVESRSPECPYEDPPAHRPPGSGQAQGAPIARTRSMTKRTAAPWTTADVSRKSSGEALLLHSGPPSPESRASPTDSGAGSRAGKGGRFSFVRILRVLFCLGSRDGYDRV